MRKFDNNNKDILSYIFFFGCTFIVLILGKEFGIINTGMSWNNDCLVGAYFPLTIIEFLSIIGLYFILGIIPFGCSVILFFLSIKFLSKKIMWKDRKTDNREINWKGKLFVLILIPTPLFVYDLIFCY
jgi:cytochrome bd-type quinol oxidase subunit 2